MWRSTLCDVTKGCLAAILGADLPVSKLAEGSNRPESCRLQTEGLTGGFPSLQSGSGAVGPSTSLLLEGSAADSTLPIQSEMRESGSLELESALESTAPPPPSKEAEKAATMPVEPLRTQAVLLEGMLGRKHDLEGSGKKASNR